MKKLHHTEILRGDTVLTTSQRRVAQAALAPHKLFLAYSHDPPAWSVKVDTTWSCLGADDERRLASVARRALNIAAQGLAELAGAAA